MVSGKWFLSLEKREKRGGVRVLEGNLTDARACVNLKLISQVSPVGLGSGPVGRKGGGWGCWFGEGLPGSSSSGRKKALAFVH